MQWIPPIYYEHVTGNMDSLFLPLSERPTNLTISYPLPEDAPAFMSLVDSLTALWKVWDGHAQIEWIKLVLSSPELDSKMVREATQARLFDDAALIQGFRELESSIYRCGAALKIYCPAMRLGDHSLVYFLRSRAFPLLAVTYRLDVIHLISKRSSVRPYFIFT